MKFNEFFALVFTVEDITQMPETEPDFSGKVSRIS